MDNQETTIYSVFSRDLYRLGSALYSSQNYITNTNSIDPSSLGAGTIVNPTTNVSFTGFGKTKFDNTETGLIFGMDKGLVKLYLGDTTNYLNWDGTQLIVSGNITATSGTIGGWTIGANTLTGGSVVLNSNTQVITVGTGANQITLDGTTGTIHSNGSTWVMGGNGVISGVVLWKNGTTTKNAADASGTQNIAHGIGYIPKKVRIKAIALNGGANTYSLSAETVYNGTTQSSESHYCVGGGFLNTVDNTFTLNTDNSGSTQRGVVTFDATNIIITWTKTGTSGGTYTLLWEAEG